MLPITLTKRLFKGIKEGLLCAILERKSYKLIIALCDVLVPKDMPKSIPPNTEKASYGTYFSPVLHIHWDVVGKVLYLKTVE